MRFASRPPIRSSTSRATSRLNSRRKPASPIRATRACASRGLTKRHTRRGQHHACRTDQGRTCRTGRDRDRGRVCRTDRGRVCKTGPDRVCKTDRDRASRTDLRRESRSNRRRSPPKSRGLALALASRSGPSARMSPIAPQSRSVPAREVHGLTPSPSGVSDGEATLPCEDRARRDSRLRAQGRRRSFGAGAGVRASLGVELAATSIHSAAAKVRNAKLMVYKRSANGPPRSRERRVRLH